MNIMRVFLKMVMIRLIVGSRMNSGTFLDIFAQFQGILNFILVSEVPILYDIGITQRAFERSK
jgi:hypothetical protein